MKALQGITRQAIFVFCFTHIIFTLLLDGQGIAKDLYPEPLQNVSSWYSDTFKDPLMSAAPGELLWFQSLICCELLVQVPFFFLACNYFGSSTLTSYPDWFRSYCMIYGAHTATTLVPILTTLATAEGLTTQERTTLLGFYLPYLLFPLLILYQAATSEGGMDFSGNATKKKI